MRTASIVVFVWLAAALAWPPGARAQRIERAPDSVAPSIQITVPARGARIETFTPKIELLYDDDRSGVAVVSFRALINGRDHSAEFEHHSQGASGQVAPSNPLPLGENTLTIELADRAGNIGRAGWLSAVADPGVGPRRHVELVLDASGSMLDKLLDNTRIAVAKGAVKSLIRALPDDTPLGLRVFKGCDNIASLIPISEVDKAAFTATLDKIQPEGGTPIVASLLQSFQALSRRQDVERVSILVTDGGESCNGAMKEAAEQARELSIRVIVISFDIKEQTVNDQLRQLADMTGGAYFNAQDGAELQAALERSVLRLGYAVVDAKGTQVARGEVNGDRVMLPIGTYEVRFDVSSSKVAQEVTVGPLTETSVRLRQAGSGVAIELATK
jgi:hypothetical protein